MRIIVDTDLRPLLRPARDQGQRPTCLAFAATAAHEASRNDVGYLSTEHLFFSGVQRSHRNPRRGLNRASVAEALKYDGQPDEAAWPYSEQMPDSVTWTPPATTDTFHKATIVFSPRSIGEICKVIQEGAPVVLLVSVTTAMYTPDAEGVVRSGPSDATTTTRHALLAVAPGYADDGSYLLVRNSWGLGWGYQGHGWLPEPYVATHLHDTGLIHNEGRIA